MSNFFKVLFHAVVMAAIMALAFILKASPLWLNISIGSVLNSIYAYLVATYASASTIGFARKF